MKDKAEHLISLFKTKFAEDHLRFSDLPGVTGSWTPQRLVTLYGFIQEDQSHDDIAPVFGVNRSTITRKINNTNWDAFEEKLTSLCEMSIKKYIKASATEYRTKAQNREEVLQRKSEVSQNAVFENLQSKMVECVKALEVPRMVPTTISKKTNRTPEHMVLMLSDLHVGLDFSSNETGGLNAYSIDVFRKRAENLQKAVVDIFSLHSQLYGIPELHVFGLGDMVHGTNMGGEWGPAYTKSDVFEQTNVAGTICADMISDWSKYFQKITFTGLVGNHGRGGRDKNSDKVAANWDNVSYLVLDAALRGHKNVEITKPNSWWTRREVNGNSFMLLHGDYMGSSPAKLEAENRKLQDMIAPLGQKPFKYLCLGHFHRHQTIETTNGSIFVNGSFVGGDMYSMQQMRSASRPTQTLMGVHPEHGVTWSYNLDLSTKRD